MTTMDKQAKFTKGGIDGGLDETLARVNKVVSPLDDRENNSGRPPVCLSMRSLWLKLLETGVTNAGCQIPDTKIVGPFATRRNPEPATANSSLLIRFQFFHDAVSSSGRNGKDENWEYLRSYSKRSKVSRNIALALFSLILRHSLRWDLSIPAFQPHSYLQPLSLQRPPPCIFRGCCPGIGFFPALSLIQNWVLSWRGVRDTSEDQCWWKPRYPSRCSIIAADRFLFLYAKRLSSIQNSREPCWKAWPGSWTFFCRFSYKLLSIGHLHYIFYFGVIVYSADAAHPIEPPIGTGGPMGHTNPFLLWAHG